jgi:single-strand DNA-binding protein
MSGSLNLVQLIGNLGRDPEIRSTSSGTRLANLNIATSEMWRDRNSGEKKQRTEWHRVVVWPEGMVDFADRYLHKGDKVYIQGKLETRKWTDQSGQERYTTEIQVKPFGGVLTSLDSGSQGNGNGGTGRLRDQAGDGYGDAYEQPQQRARAPAGAYGELDDEIPF